MAPPHFAHVVKCDEILFRLLIKMKFDFGSRAVKDLFGVSAFEVQRIHSESSSVSDDHRGSRTGRREEQPARLSDHLSPTWKQTIRLAPGPATADLTVIFDPLEGARMAITA